MTNYLVEVLGTLKIKSSIRTKGCPYGNAIGEATVKALRTELLKMRF